MTSGTTSAFIDLATYDEIEKYLYGGNPDEVTSYFVKRTTKSTWFSQVPVILTNRNGTPAFGQDWSVVVSRQGDYLLYAWLRITIPAVTLQANNQFGANGRLRWTRNLLHNLLRHTTVTFNDLEAQKIDNFFLDFWAAFTVPAGKRNGYNNMIGNVDDLIQPIAPGQTLPSVILNLPLPYFFSRDSGVSLPTAALPYNEIRLTFSMRNWNELLILDNIAAAPGTKPSFAPAVTDLGTEPVLGNTQVWANYAVVSNDERKRMGCAARSILIEQCQTAPVSTFSPATNTQQSFDIRFSHPIKALFFSVQNKTVSSQYSNYTAATPVPGATIVDFTPSGAVDPIDNVTLIYENTQRLSNMGADYFSLVNPYYHAPVIPNETGYHLYSYALDFYNTDPTGSTNYGKLTNVSIVPAASAGAVAGATAAGGAGSGADYTQTYNFVVVGLNNNIILISGGALGLTTFIKRKPKIGRRLHDCGKPMRGKRYNFHPTLLLAC